MSARTKPYVLGLTGGVGCGKSTAAAALAELGATVVDADQISHALTSEPGAALDAIRRAFGDDVFGADGQLNRAALAGIVFEHEESRRALEGILHPAIQREMLRQMEQAAAAGAQVVVLDVPLLFESGLDALCDETWVISAEREQQALRVMSRDRMTRGQADARIDSQMPLSEKEARANRVIANTRGVQDLKSEIARQYRDLIRRI